MSPRFAFDRITTILVKNLRCVRDSRVVDRVQMHTGVVGNCRVALCVGQRLSGSNPTRLVLAKLN